MNILTESKKLVRSNTTFILENLKLAKQYADQGKLSQEDLKKLAEADPTPQKKFVGWMAKIWIAEKPDFDDLRNTVEEYNVFLNKGKAKTKDINAFKTFKDLHSEVDGINRSGEGISVRELESDYDVVIDNQDLYIASPHTHEASRKLGLSKFAFRDCQEGEGKDSAWCTTVKAPDHFNDYYYTNDITFYYIRVKSPELISKLKEAFPKKYKTMEVVALAVLENGRIDGYDGLDKQLSSKDIKTFTDIIGIS
jgi:hypothetical protein